MKIAFGLLVYSGWVGGEGEIVWKSFGLKIFRSCPSGTRSVTILLDYIAAAAAVDGAATAAKTKVARYNLDSKDFCSLRISYDVYCVLLFFCSRYFFQIFLPHLILFVPFSDFVNFLRLLMFFNRCRFLARLDRQLNRVKLNLSLNDNGYRVVTDFHATATRRIVSVYARWTSPFSYFLEILERIFDNLLA